MNATYQTPEIFKLVLAAILDDQIYASFRPNATKEELEKDRIARVITLCGSLFGAEGVGIAGRCNQGVRHELVGCLNGVYPKNREEYWYFIEDIHAAIEQQVGDYLERVTVSRLDSMDIKLESGDLKLSLRDFLLLDQFGMDGHFVSGDPEWMAKLIQTVSRVLEIWAAEHFLKPEATLEHFTENAASMIVSALTRAADKVLLFKAWGQLASCVAVSSIYGDWLPSNTGCKQVIDTVVNGWLSRWTLDNIDDLLRTGIPEDLIRRLAALGDLLANGERIDSLPFAVDPDSLDDFSAGLNELFRSVDSIEAFSAIPLEPFEQLVSGIMAMATQTPSGLNLEQMLWALIRFKQQNPHRDLTSAVSVFRKEYDKHLAEKGRWQLDRLDVDSMLKFLSSPQDCSEIIIWSIVNRKWSIVLHLVTSAFRNRSVALPETRLLSQATDKNTLRTISEQIQSSLDEKPLPNVILFRAIALIINRGGTKRFLNNLCYDGFR